MWLVVAVVAGIGLAVQARINGELALRADDGVAAALLSFAGGEVILLAALVLLPAVRRGIRRLAGEVRGGGLAPGYLLGGLGGAFLVLAQGLTVAAIGVAIFTVAVVAGQTMSSLFVDRLGVGPGGVRAVTATRVAGAFLTLGAVVLAVSDQLGTASVLVLAALPLLAGAGISLQQAVTARVGSVAGATNGVAGALPAALVNFTGGTAVLALVFAVEIAFRGLPEPLPAEPVLYLGGPVGIVFVCIASVIVGRMGVLLFSLAAIGGQLTGSLLLDVFVPAAAGRLTGWTVTGTALALAAVGVAALPTRRRQPS